MFLNILDGANGQVLNVHSVERIPTIGAPTFIAARLIVFKTGTTIVLTACLAVALCVFCHFPPFTFYKQKPVLRCTFR